jgi:hypothetical protein
MVIPPAAAWFELGTASQLAHAQLDRVAGDPDIVRELAFLFSGQYGEVDWARANGLFSNEATPATG